VLHGLAYSYELCLGGSWNMASWGLDKNRELGHLKDY
jgi:hypothetical protein